MRQRRERLRNALWVVLAIWAAGAGCQSCQPGTKFHDGVTPRGPSWLAPGTSKPWKKVAADVPRELAMTSLPPYTIDPPDILLIDAVKVIPLPPYRIEPLDSIVIQFPAKPLPEKDLEALAKAGLTVSGVFPVEPDGTVNLGLKYGPVPVSGLTLEEARAAVLKRLRPEVKKEILEQGDLAVELAQSRGLQQIRGEHLVRPDGTVGLGAYGSVHVAGLTLQEAKAAVEQHLAQFLLNPEVSVDVFAFNSKVYYVIFDGGGSGLQIVRLPVTGSETVLDALGLVNGLPPVSSKHHVWVARPDPAGAGCQTLPVNLKAITRCGETATNYMIHPGDRIFVESDALIRLDTFLAKLLAPVERVFGAILLGNETIQSLQGTGVGGRFF